MFDLTARVLEPAIGFIVQGHDLRLAGIGRRLFGSATVSGDTIRVRTEVQFSAPTGVYLGDTESMLTYVREGEEYLPRGGEDPDELLDVGEGPSNEVLLRYCMDRLREIAKGQEGETLAWPQHLVAGAKKTTEVRELRGLLARQRSGPYGKNRSR